MQKIIEDYLIHKYSELPINKEKAELWAGDIAELIKNAVEKLIFNQSFDIDNGEFEGYRQTKTVIDVSILETFFDL